MKTTLIAALFCATSLLSPCAHAQQSEADRQALAQLRAKAETGDAQAQFEKGTAGTITGAVQIVTRNETVLARPTIIRLLALARPEFLAVETDIVNTSEPAPTN